MALAQRFEDLEAWQKARELTRVVYEATSDGAWAKDYGLRDQIRRAAVSAMSNIAEGFERRGPIEFGRFLLMAKASAGEVRSQLYVALDLGYVDAARFDAVRSLAETTSGKVAGLANYLKGRDRPSKSPV
jgi:four helix bundle protein